MRKRNRRIRPYEVWTPESNLLIVLQLYDRAKERIQILENDIKVLQGGYHRE